jgi:rhamnulokinase
MSAGTAGSGGPQAAIGLAAVDLGASSGRVIHGRVGPGLLELTELHRFRNGPVALPDGLYWDILGLYRGSSLPSWVLGLGTWATRRG